MRKHKNKMYLIFKKAGKITRDNFSPDPFKELNEKGIIGKCANKLGNKMIDKPVKDLAFYGAGTIYKPKKHNPAFGSILYNLFYFSILGLIPMLIKFILKIIIQLL